MRYRLPAEQPAAIADRFSGPVLHLIVHDDDVFAYTLYDAGGRIDEYDSGGEQFKRFRERDRDHQIEQVGAELRSKMPFLDPVTVVAGQAQAAATKTPAASGSKA